MEVGFQFFSHASRYETEKPYELFLDKLPSEIPSSNCEFVRRVVKLQDIRSTTLRPRLEVEGFRVVNDNSIGLNGVSDLLDDSKLQEYLDKTIELVKRECGSSKVICYDWRYRTSSRSERNNAVGGDISDRVRPLEPAERVHIDNSTRGALGQLKRFLAPSEMALYDNNRARIQLLNVWRPLSHPVEDCPLAFCDRRTVSESDLVEVDRPADRHIDYGCYIRHHPEQKWYWLSLQTPSEPFMFLVWDSELGYGAPHGAFRSPVKVERSRPRQSVEVRLIVFYNKSSEADHFKSIETLQGQASIVDDNLVV